MYEMWDDTNVGHFVWKNYLNCNTNFIIKTRFPIPSLSIFCMFYLFVLFFYIHGKCNIFIESLINYIPNQNEIETENFKNTNVAINDY